ncbi:Dyp-type peroxidase family protein [Hydrogenophaga sp. T4]|nr:Dyp-type peroxidase family protein [Hydrogenophaga sp. T4]
MSVAHLAQPGILEPIPAQGRYLSCQLRVGAEPQTVLRRLGSQADGLSTVVALGASLVRELGAEIPGLKTFCGIEGALIKLPATPTDLLVWLRGTDRGHLLIRSRHIETLLAPAFDVTDITDASTTTTAETSPATKTVPKTPREKKPWPWPFCPKVRACWRAAASWRCSAGATT